MSGGYLTLEVSFGGGRKARVQYSAGVTNGEINLHQVMAQDAAMDVLKELGEHALAEIKQQIAYEHAKEKVR